MRLTKEHLKWYQQQQVPQWGNDLQQTYPVSIDRIVNLNAGIKVTGQKYLDDHNAIALLQLVRKNIASGAVQLSVYRESAYPDTLLDYMRGYTQQDGRLPKYRRWARTMMKKQMQQFTELYRPLLQQCQ